MRWSGRGEFVGSGGLVAVGAGAGGLFRDIFSR